MNFNSAVLTIITSGLVLGCVTDTPMPNAGPPLEPAVEPPSIELRYPFIARG